MAASIQDLTQNYPAAPADLPVSTAAQAELDALGTTTGTAGAGNLLANRVVYDDAGTSTLLYARANAIATARKIRGVTVAAATAAATATIQESGIIAIKGASDIAPVIGAKLYLSGEAGGLVTTILTASMSPVLIGYCRSAAVDGSGNVSVKLAIDEDRDASKLWLLETWAPTAASQIYDFLLNPALWDLLELRSNRVNGVSAGNPIYFRADGALVQHPFSGVGYNTLFYTSDYFAITRDNGAGEEESGVATLRPGNPLWNFESRWSMGAAAYGSQFGNGVFAAPTVSVGVQAAAANMFKANIATVELWGRKKE